MRKHVFGGMWTARTQISLYIWSGPSLSTNRIIEYYKMYKWRPKAWLLEKCIPFVPYMAGWPESVHIAHVWRHFFASRGLLETLATGVSTRQYDDNLASAWQNGMWTQWKLRSAWTSAPSVRRSDFLLSAWKQLWSLATNWANSEDWSKCPVWSESLPGACSIL